MGREILCWDIDGNFAGDTVVMLEVLIDFAGDTVVTLEVLIDFAGGKKTSPRTIFPCLLAEDNPVISW